MIDKEEWRKTLGNLDKDELEEVSKIIKELKKTSDNREEFLTVLRRYNQKYPEAYLFCTGSAGKGAWECEGEWGVDQWNDVYTDRLEEIYEEVDKNELDADERELLDRFETIEDFRKAFLNIKLNEFGYKSKEYTEFEKDLKNAKHVPKWTYNDASDLSNGVSIYGVVDIRTGKYYYFTTSAY